MIEIVEGDVESAPEADVRHIDYNDNLKSLNRPTRISMMEFKRRFWDTCAGFLRDPGDKISSWSEVGRRTDFNRITLSTWRHRYSWFEPWLFQKDASYEAKLECIRDAVIESLMEDIEKNRLGPREKIVLLKECGDQIGLTSTPKTKVTTADIVSALGELNESRSSGVIEDKVSNLRIGPPAGKENGTADRQSHGESGKLPVSADPVLDTGRDDDPAR